MPCVAVQREYMYGRAYHTRIKSFNPYKKNIQQKYDDTMKPLITEVFPIPTCIDQPQTLTNL